MSDEQSGKSQARPTIPRKVALLGAGATALAVLNMSIGGEAEPQIVMILQYAALGGGLLALVGGLIMMIAQK